MKKETMIVGFILVVVTGLLIAFSPDVMTMLFVIVQALFLVLGFFFGIFRVSRMSSAFVLAKNAIIHCKDDIPSDDIWYVISRPTKLFYLDCLDKDFEIYKQSVNKVFKNENAVLPDIDDVYNEDAMAIKSYRNIVNQIPETLTGIGILGTFVGLILGIGAIGFSSVTAAVESLQTMINGLETAFYTSIAGVILSILFNMISKFEWNIMMRDLYLFCDEFHKSVIPSTEDQMKNLEVKYFNTMMKFANEHPKESNEAQD